jgi:flagellar basal-body rod modification protein FlgD
MQITESPIATTQNTATSTNETASEQFSEDFNTFLNLLTAQIQNQDPLQPLDSTQFVEQLATFSSLEQEVKTNDHLSSISQMMAQFLAQSQAEEG